MFSKHLLVAVTATATAILFGCQKEIIQKSEPQTANTSQPVVYKFKETVSVYADDPAQGYLNLTVSSDDKTFLADYVGTLRNMKLGLEAVEQPQEEDNGKDPEVQTVSGAVSIHFDWSHYNFNTEKGKMYQVKFTPKDASKALVMVGSSMPNVTGFTSTSGYACVNIYNTNKYFSTTNNTADWGLYNSTNSNGYFYGITLDYHDNIEVRTFLSSQTTGMGVYSFFMSGTDKVYYIPRLNYSGPALPATYQDISTIKMGSSLDLYRGGPSPALVTFYIAG